MANYTMTPTAALIYAEWMKRGKAERPRTYLGASIIGHECDMYLWMYFRGIIRDNFDGRMYRLFDRGKREESVFCNDLRSIGCDVRDVDADGNQFSVSALGGHFGGHLDAVCKGLKEAPTKWHVAEFKTHSSDSFKKLCKDGVKKSKPMHYAQMMVYMGLTKLSDAVYLAVNKDNDELYTERIKFDDKDYEDIMNRAKNIILDSSSQKCSKRQDDYRCKACPCSSLCWDKTTIIDATIPLSCRTCCHSTADVEHDGASFKCALGHSCSTEKSACDDYMILPSFVRADLIDGEKDVINYSINNCSFSVHKGVNDVIELQKIGAEQLDGLKKIRDVIPEAKVSSSDSILAKYQGKDYFVYHTCKLEQLKDWCGKNPIANWSKPIVKDEYNGAKYFDYGDTMIEIKGDDVTIRSQLPPF